MKENEIKKVYDLWLGGFISGDDAMCRIGNTLKKTKINDIKIVDLNTSNVLIQCEKALIKHHNSNNERR